MKSDEVGIFRYLIRSKLTGYAARTAHFNYTLLRAGEEQLATAMEKQSLWIAADDYGETSEQALAVLNEMGTLRAYNRSYERAVELQGQAVAFAKQHYSTDKDKLLEIQRDLADAQVKAGLFAQSMETLAALKPNLPPESDLRTHYTVTSTMAAAAFGLRSYGEATRLSQANIRRALEAGYSGSLMDSHVELIAAQLAQGQMNEAKATLKTCLIEHKRIIDRKPDTFFDMYEVALACIVLGELEEAKRLARVTNRTTSLTYEEFVHMLAVFAAGERAQAQTLAKQFLARLSGGDDITVRRDVDSMLRGVLLTIADPVPAKVTALGQLWGQQVETLKKRPLQNYLFARVMVLTLEALKKVK